VTPTFSVILPTYNRASLAERTVQAFLKQQNVSFELLVVNDGSSDDTSEVIKACAREDSRIHLLEQVNSGLAAARNAGFAKAVGQYVLFNDDDIIPETGFLQAHLELHRQYEGGAVVSRIHIPPHLMTTPFMNFWNERTESGVTGKADGTMLGWGGFWFATLSIEKRLLPEKPFAHFKGYGWEEHELGLRLWQRDIKPRLAVKATASHEDALTLESALGKWRSMGRTAWEFYRLRPTFHTAMWTGVNPVSLLYKRVAFPWSKAERLLAERDWETEGRANEHYRFLLEAAYTQGLLEQY
jgi:glycosyltransferase involved in cell wall biosynthesis